MDVSLLKKKPVYWTTLTVPPNGSKPNNQSFSGLVVTDALLAYAEKTGESFLHFWHSNQPTVILGMMDTQLTHFEKGMAYFSQKNTSAFVRHSGGLAVPSDEGTLNFSLILNFSDHSKPSIEEGYLLVLNLLKETFIGDQRTIRATEVPASYCPGDFDIVLNGKKVAGLAQRRIKNSVAVMGYISVSGDQIKRAENIQEFYSIAKGRDSSQNRFPDIDPSVMTTVAENVPSMQTVGVVQNQMLDVLSRNGVLSKEFVFPEKLMEEYEQSKTKLIKRNQKMLGNLFQKEVFV